MACSEQQGCNRIFEAYGCSCGLIRLQLPLHTAAASASYGCSLHHVRLQARDCDALCHVVRAFVDDETIHVEGRVDPAADIEVRQ